MVLQVIKRKRFNKLPLQANFYPTPSAIFIEDGLTRLSLLSAQPLGATSLKGGQIEVNSLQPTDKFCPTPQSYPTAKISFIVSNSIDVLLHLIQPTNLSLPTDFIINF